MSKVKIKKPKANSALSPESSVLGFHQEVTQSSALSPHHFSLRIADLIFHATTDAPGMKLQIDGAMEWFLVGEGEPDVRVRVAWDDLSKRTWGKKVFDSGSPWQMFQEDGCHCVRFTSPIFGLVPYKAAYFDRDFISGAVYLHRPYFNTDQALYPLEFPLDELLTINLLARGRGVEIHACGVIDSTGNGHLFVGQSGAGKTTMAKLWQNEKGIEILSDDRIILRQIDQRFWMYGTPWHGEARLASPARAPLRWVYFLHHGQKNEFMPTKGAQAIARLFTSSFVPFYYPAGLEFTLGFYEEVTKEVPCYELRFAPDERVMRYLEGLSHE